MEELSVAGKAATEKISRLQSDLDHEAAVQRSQEKELEQLRGEPRRVPAGPAGERSGGAGKEELGVTEERLQAVAERDGAVVCSARTGRGKLAG